MAAAPPAVGAVPAKLKIRIKGLSVLGAKQKAQQQQVSTGFPYGLPAVIGDQLADLHAAVEAFCQQGLRGLPGAALLLPWTEPCPVEQLAPWAEPAPPQEQQGNGFSLHAQQQQQHMQEQPGVPQQPAQQTAQRRVRKRRAPDPPLHAGDGAAADPQDMQHLAWGNLKRQRSNQLRAARDTAQLSTSIHSMLHAASGDAAAAPASPSVVSQPRAAGTAAGTHALARISDKAAAAAAGAQQPSRLQRSSSRLASPAPAAAEPETPGVLDYAAAAAPAAGKPEPVAAQAMDCDDLFTAATDVPTPATSGAAAEPAGASQQQLEQEPQQEPQQQEYCPQQQLPQRQETMQEPQAVAKEVQQQQEQQKLPARKQQQKPLPPRKQKQQVVKQEQQKALVSSSAAAERATACQGEVEQPALVAAVSEPAAPAAAAADLKPESPPSETSHQQHMPEPQQLQQQLLPCTAEQQPAVAVEQQQQQEHESPGAPDLQAEHLIKQPEQTAVSRDRSQCSLPRGAEPPSGPADVSMPAPVAAVAAAAPNAAGGSSSTAGAAGRSSGRLLELAPGSMTPAARALAMLSAVPEVRQRVLPPEDRPVRTQEEGLAFLQTLQDKAKQLKHQGDKRHKSVNGWDVYGLSFYALSSVEFLMYWDTLLRLLNKLRAANQPVDKLQQLLYNLSSGLNPFLRQTSSLSVNGMSACSNCKGPDMAKMALRMLLERISAISALRNLHNQRKQLEAHIRLLKSNGASYTSGSDAVGSSVRPAAAPPQLPQQQQQQQVAAVQQQAVRLQASRAGAAAAAPAAGAGKPPSPSGSSWSPAGASGTQQQQQQQFNKRSPDDSNASNQDRMHLPVGAEHLSGMGGGVGAAAGAGAAQGGQTERALALAKSERALMDSMQELLKLTDSMHQTVMRIQQFLERPEVLASEHARAAALHISVLGLDAGMFSIPRVAAHTEAAVTCILKLLRRS